MAENDIIIYKSKDGKTEIGLTKLGDKIWLTQPDIAKLFGTSVANISTHIKNILDDKELSEYSTIKNYLRVAKEGGREVEREVPIYSLEMILAVGFRVRSQRAVEFRQWAIRNLVSYLEKGFLINEERLKNPDAFGAFDYFDELLEKIRDIRASEKRFYQKVRDLFALSYGYDPQDKATQMFFAEVQNKLLYAVTKQTAAEIIVSRADPTKPNMNLTAWKGSIVRKGDIIIAKNYLKADEIDTLNRLVSIFLDSAELRVKRLQTITMDFWKGAVDKLLMLNDFPVLNGSGTVSRVEMEQIVGGRYDEFDAKRRAQEAIAADQEDMKELEDIEKKISQKKKRK